MDLSGTVNNFIKNKSDNNTIKIRFGKRVFDNAFEFIIDIYQFENILDNIKKDKKYDKIIYKKLAKYYDKNKVLIVAEDGSNKCLRVKSKKCKDLKFDDNFDIMLDMTEFEFTSNDNFPPKYQYENIEIIEDLIFIFNNVEIEFMKIYDSEIYHEIAININKKETTIGNILDYFI